MTPSEPVSPVLPAPRRAGTYSIALVCLGNICRSPMADVVLTDAVARAGLEDRVTVASSGTGSWHVGEPMDRRAAATLVAAGLDPTHHRAQHFDASWFAHDLVLVMDRDNHRDVLAAGPPEADRVAMFRDFDPREAGGAVPDPYYGGDDGFEEVLAMVERTSASLVAALARALAEDAGGRSGR